MNGVKFLWIINSNEFRHVYFQGAGGAQNVLRNSFARQARTEYIIRAYGPL